MEKCILLNILFSLIVPITLVAQQVEMDSLLVEPESTYQLTSQAANGIALKCEACTIERGYFVVDKDTLAIISDPHEPQSALVLLPGSFTEIYFYSGSIAGRVNLFFIDAGASSKRNIRNQRIYENDCEGTAIPPKIWREGLSAPSYTPSFTKVEHLVIHHSATSNIAGDPYAAVRSIYLYHTEVNGWSDIGYNYLISPDGQVFQGRDDRGLADADNVVGAHMCGVNSTTMGICVLGTFTSELPTSAALDALTGLIKWKAAKEDIPIFGSKVHAIGPNSANLPPQDLARVCGHRDGCRPSYTECPGDLLYKNLEGVKLNASEKICQPDEELVNLLAYPNPSATFIKVDFDWHRLEIIDVRGSLIESYSAKREEVSVGMLSSGVYFFAYHTAEYGKMVKKIIKL